MNGQTVAAYFLQSDEDFFCDEHAPLCVTKTLGVPYLPEGKALPLDRNGEPMMLLFQMNFEEFPPLPGFPEAGMMQIFTANEFFETDEYGPDTVCVRFYDSVDYDCEEPEGGFFTDEDNPFGLGECRYDGSGATLTWHGTPMSMPLGTSEFRGIIVGGTMSTYTLYADSWEFLEYHNGQRFPLLRISSSEQRYNETRTSYFFLVDEQEFAERKINRVTVLVEPDEE